MRLGVLVVHHSLNRTAVVSHAVVSHAHHALRSLADIVICNLHGTDPDDTRACGFHLEDTWRYKGRLLNSHKVRPMARGCVSAEAVAHSGALFITIDT